MVSEDVGDWRDLDLNGQLKLCRSDSRKVKVGFMGIMAG